MNNLSITPGKDTVMYAVIYMTNGTVVAKNNIVNESDFPNYTYRSGTNGTLQSDYNDFYCSDIV